jgi:DNA-binding CsgD family transcriptional regulator
MSPDNPAGEYNGEVGSRTMLTHLDAQILEGIAAGTATPELAKKLHLSRPGVEYHVSTMLRRFRVPNRAALISKAYSIGVFRTGCWPPTVVPDYIR